jgi:hypothetical protein
MSKTSRTDRPAFQEVQYAFAAHIRDPAAHARPAGVEERRMAIYRELFYNNVEGFIRDGFPVLRSITPDAAWHRRVRAFFARHRCRTPYFAEISREFVDWLAGERGEHPDDPPFIAELAHYEWVELALQSSDADRELPAVDHNGDVFSAAPVVSPLAWHLAYCFPVHRISPEFQPAAPDGQPTYLVVYRDRLDAVHFLEINAVTYRLLELLKEHPGRTGRDAVKQVADELRHPDPAAVAAHGRALLDDLRSRNILIGTLTRAEGKSP